jgi:pyrroloquinoline-quinone synthase
MMGLFDRLGGARERWNVLRHPFYVRWERGELTRDELAFYAGEYRHAVVALARTAAVGGSAEHAAEEEAHLDLWDDFAAAVDAPLDRNPTPETRACARSWTSDDPLEAAAILYAVESSQPAISRTKLAGLVDHYDFEPDSAATRYFTVHATRDDEHAAESRAILEREAAAVDTDRLVGAAEAALEGNWRLLDSVEAARPTL